MLTYIHISLVQGQVPEGDIRAVTTAEIISMIFSNFWWSFRIFLIKEISLERGRRAVCASDWDEKDGSRHKVSFYANEHAESRIDFKDSWTKFKTIPLLQKWLDS